MALKNRCSIRLKGYDYSQNGAYFITICTNNRECILGKINDGKIILNDAGKMVEKIWNEMPCYYPGVEIDEYIVMPNHIHGIIIINHAGADPCVRPEHKMVQIEYRTGQTQGFAPTPGGLNVQLSLPKIIQCYKSLTTKKYINGVNDNKFKSFEKRIWQRNYYERIIRDDDELNRIRQYIINNPAKWNTDEN